MNPVTPFASPFSRSSVASVLLTLACACSAGTSESAAPVGASGASGASSSAGAGGASSAGAAGASSAGAAGVAGVAAGAAGVSSAGAAGESSAGASGAAGAAGSASGLGRDSLTPHFRDWLAQHGYGSDDFPRDDLTGGSFGGCDGPTDTPTRDPVVFVHGNSDRAHGGELGGFLASRDHFLANGYRPCELYATTWGPADKSQASAQDHDRAYVLRVRRFFDAVLGYTGHARIDVVTHSMGVTLARQAIQGGATADTKGSYDVGAPLSTKVDSFIGIAGANLGLTSCYSASTLATCGKIAGLYPGSLVGASVVGRSKLLETLDQQPHDEGARVHTIWSPADDLIGFGGVVWGKYTSQIAGQDGETKLDGLTHLQLKDQTVEQQLKLVGP